MRLPRRSFAAPRWCGRWPAPSMTDNRASASVSSQALECSKRHDLSAGAQIRQVGTRMRWSQRCNSGLANPRFQPSRASPMLFFRCRSISSSVSTGHRSSRASDPVPEHRDGALFRRTNADANSSIFFADARRPDQDQTADICRSRIAISAASQPPSDAPMMYGADCGQGW